MLARYMAWLFGAKREVTASDAKKLKNLAGFKRQEARKYFSKGMTFGVIVGAAVTFFAALAIF